jgi:FMN-dependent NADH-azoreductase
LKNLEGWMMKILHVSCSPRGHAAESYRLSRRIVDLLLKIEPTAILADRAIGDGTLPHVDAEYALAQQSAMAELPENGSIARSEELIRELESADVVVIGTPMHNLSVPSALKAWIDHVVRAHRTFEVGPNGKTALLKDRPVFVAVSSGGLFSGERARQPDFLTPYLKAVLGTIGLHRLAFFSVEGTGYGPAAVADARLTADLNLQAYFSSFSLDPQPVPRSVSRDARLLPG